MSKRLLEGIIDYYEGEEILTADGFDEAVIGFEERTMRLIYSVSKCLKILMVEQEMNLDDSIEFFDFNVKGAYMGEKTPIWCEDMLLQ